MNETQTGYFLGDALGSVRQVVDPQAEILLAQSYSPYGEVLSSVGDYETAFSYTPYFVWGQAGEMTDGTGLVNLRARYANFAPPTRSGVGYDPGTGRFISRDTWAGNYNNPITLGKWLYANGNPLMYTDSNGNKAIDTNCGYLGEDYCSKTHLPSLPSTGKLSSRGATFIKYFEQARRWPYGDAGIHKGNCTIGYGTVLSYPIKENCGYEDVQKSRDFKVTDDLTGTTKMMDPNRVLSYVDMQDYFDLEIYLDEEAIKSSIMIPLSQNQFDALVSFLFNAGSSKLTNGVKINNYTLLTTYATLINNHEEKTAFYEIIKQSSFRKGSDLEDGPDPALYFRRYEEYEIYFDNEYNPDPGNNPIYNDFIN